jgi:predicted amidophosphoribosyltransferase
VARLKYRNHRAGLAGLARAAASQVADPPDIVTWAPTSPARRARRGYDQAELLAGVVGACMGRPVRRLLARQPGSAQTGRARAQRWTGPSFTVARPGLLGAWRRGGVPVAARVLVVDDVVTTGATMAAAAAVLRRAGAGSVQGLAIARTPSARGGSRLGGGVGSRVPEVLTVPQADHSP